MLCCNAVLTANRKCPPLRLYIPVAGAAAVLVEIQDPVGAAQCPVGPVPAADGGHVLLDEPEAGS